MSDFDNEEKLLGVDQFPASWEGLMISVKECKGGENWFWSFKGKPTEDQAETLFNLLEIENDETGRKELFEKLKTHNFWGTS